MFGFKSLKWIVCALGALGALGALIGVGCTQTPSSSSIEKSLRFQLVNEPLSLDPTFAEDGVALEVLTNTSDGLVGYDGSGQLQNRLAESYRISTDGKTYRFVLRSSGRWSDGRPIKAQDFVTAFRRALSPHSLSKLAPLFYPIRGARLYQQNKIPEQELGVREEEGTLVIELEYPAPYFIQALTLPPSFPLRQDILSKHQGNWPESGPVTGPYQVVTHSLDQKLILERNPYYYGEQPKIARVEMIIIGDESTGLNLFENGRLDLLTRVPYLDLRRLKEAGKILSTPILTTYYLSFNCRRPPFNDLKWRRAFAGAIRRNEIAALLDPSLTPAWSWIPPGLEGSLAYQDPSLIFEDSMAWVRKNHQAQTQPVTASFDTGIRNSKILEKVQYDIQQRLGVSLQLTHLDWKTYLRSLQVDPPSLFRLGWMAAFKDPISHLKVFTKNEANNYSGCFNMRYDQLVSEIEKMKPGMKRAQKIKVAQKILLEEMAAVVPIYHYIQNTGVSSRIKGFRMNPFGLILFKELDLE